MHVSSTRFMPKWLWPIAAVVAMALAGCEASSVQPTAQVFASLRVMDFAPSPASNVDVYWYPVGGPLPSSTTTAKIHNLGYGGGAVYTNGIKADAGGTKYHYVVTRLNSPGVIEYQSDMTLYPGKSSTLIITTTDAAAHNYTATVIDDASTAKHTAPSDTPQAGTKPTYVRFMNMQMNSGKLVLRLNDPVYGQVIGSINGTPGVDFNQISDYQGINTSPKDTSYTLYLTPVGSNDVLARLTYQTYTANDYFTVVYAGDPNRIPDDLSKLDTASAKLDRVRLRVFPDDNIGADQTNPLDSAFRYNVINALYDTSGAYIPGVKQLGITVNGDQNPERHNFTFYPVDMFTMAGSNPKAFDQGNGDTVWDVHFMSSNIPTHTIELRGAALDNAGKTHSIFALTGTAGIDETRINADTTISILLLNGNADPKKSVKHFEIGIPARVASDSITLVFTSAISLPPGGTDPKTIYHLTAGGNTTDIISLVPGQDAFTMTLPASVGPLTITYDLGGKGGHGTVAGEDTETFTPEAGGVYEIVATGVRQDLYTGGHNRLLVILTNRNELPH
jgi:hypothetical protein